ncbi:MAG: hypothetical protein INR64_12850 [Caulobacteraceae bacterium]|nr:hypothetical protein [Caulobacter sp.]
MLRAVVLAVAAALFVLSLVALVVGGPGALGLVIGAGVLLAGTLFERVRYKHLAATPPEGRFRPTPERFIDTETGAPVTVWVDPATGERKYVRD